MAASRQNSNTSNDQVSTRMSVVEYKVDELKKGQDRIENKLDLINYVPITTYENDKKENTKNFATKDDLKGVSDTLKPFKTVFWGFIGTIVSVMTTAFIYFVIGGGLK